MPAKETKHKSLSKILPVVAMAVIGLASVLMVTHRHINSTAHLLASAPDPVTATEQETVAFIASDSFGKLKPEAKQDYLEKARQAHETDPRPLLPATSSASASASDLITKAQRDKAFQNILPILNQVVKQRLDAYEGMAPQAQRAQLDLFVDRIKQMQSNGSEGFDPDRFKQFLEHVDPYTRAKMRKNLPALEQRMRERGVSVPWKATDIQ
ncbi:MAG: hypothetical protein K9N55_13710 [Phycisphaerae bacterium]|nr:hypothetical protein [Phycisphaerae bacterium]